MFRSVLALLLVIVLLNACPTLGQERSLVEVANGSPQTTGNPSLAATQQLADLLFDDPSHADEAILLYTGLVTDKPDDLENYFRLAQLLTRRSRIQEAKAFLSRAIKAGLHSPRALALWGQLLLWTDEPKKAAQVLGPLLNAKPSPGLRHEERSRVTIAYAQSLYRLELIAAARSVLDALLVEPDLSPSDLAQAHAELGYVYQHLNDWSKAAANFKKALAYAPTLTRVREELAVVQSWSQPKAALATIAKIPSDPPRPTKVELALLRSLSALGERERAAEVLASALKRFRTGEELADAAHYVSELGLASLAETTARRALEKGQLSIAKRIEMAGDLARWGNDYQSLAILEGILREEPTNLAARLKLGRLLTSMHRFHEAKAVLEALPIEPQKPEELAEVHCALSELALSTNEPTEALKLATAKPLVAATCPLSVTRAQMRLNNLHAAREVLRNTAPQNVSQAMEHLKLLITLQDYTDAAKLLEQLNFRNLSAAKEAIAFLSDHDANRPSPCVALQTADELLIAGELLEDSSHPQMALLCYQKVAQFSPELLLARIHLAELQAQSGNFSAAFSDYSHLHREFPHNRRISFGYARALSWAKHYETSIQLYEETFAKEPHDYILMTEAGRVAAWKRDSIGINELYGRILEPSVDSILAANTPTSGKPFVRIASVSPRDESGKSLPWEKYETLRENLSDATSSSTNTTTSATRAMVTKLYPLYQIQRAAWYEREAQLAFLHTKMLTAHSDYLQLITIEPWNQEALFGRAQTSCILGCRHESKRVYETLLEVNPTHSFAQLVHDQLLRDEQPALTTQAQLWNEKGRGVISDISRRRASLGLEIPAGQNWRTKLSYVAFEEKPGERLEGSYPRSITAHGFSMESDGVLTEELRSIMRWTHKEYENPLFTPTDNGLLQVEWQATDAIRAGLNFERRDEISNVSGILQDIQSNSLGATLELRPSPNLRFNIDGVQSWYDDNNDGVFSHFVGGYEFTDYPRILRLGLVHDYRTTRQKGFLFQESGVTPSFIHPYWTPDEYHLAGVLLEWHQDLATKRACGAPRDFLSVKLLLKDDTDQNPGAQIDMSWEVHLSPSVRTSINTSVHQSEQWDALGAWASLGYHF